jgi:hypothetical protein
LIGQFTPVPNQRLDFNLEEGAGITVLALNTDWVSAGGRIDGFTITGATGANSGGGILVNGYADFLEISNNILRETRGTWAAACGPMAFLLTIGDPTMFTVHPTTISIFTITHPQEWFSNFGGNPIFNGPTIIRCRQHRMRYYLTNGGAVAH